MWKYVLGLVGAVVVILILVAVLRRPTTVVAAPAGTRRGVGGTIADFFGAFAGTFAAQAMKPGTQTTQIVKGTPGYGPASVAANRPSGDTYGGSIIQTPGTGSSSRGITDSDKLAAYNQAIAEGYPPEDAAIYLT